MSFGTKGCMYNCGDECTGECIRIEPKTKMSKEYIIEVMEGPLTKTYNANREANTFYYDYNSLIGVSTIDVRNKRVVSYKPKQR